MNFTPFSLERPPKFYLLKTNCLQDTDTLACIPVKLPIWYKNEITNNYSTLKTSTDQSFNIILQPIRSNETVNTDGHKNCLYVELQFRRKISL